VVAILAAFSDVRHAIGFSSFAVLTYYAVTNASALTLRRGEGRPLRIVAMVGLVGCLVLAVFMPPRSVAAGLIASFIGIVYYVSLKTISRHQRDADVSD
jgi:APA family basic amino acid/polyamine antiporter